MGNPVIGKPIAIVLEKVILPIVVAKITKNINEKTKKKKKKGFAWVLKK